MSERRHEEVRVLGKKRGIPIYSSNPSIPSAEEISKPRKTRLGNERKGVVFSDTGEIVEASNAGGALFYEWEEVDKERFVKLFLTGLKQAADLTKAGLTMFAVVYQQMQKNPNTDRVEINFYIANELIQNISDRTYQRGLRDLLTKGFIYRSPSENLYYVNIKYMFNGNRLAFVKGVYLKGTPSPMHEPKQLSLLDDKD